MIIRHYRCTTAPILRGSTRAEKLLNAFVILLSLYVGGCVTTNSPQRQAEYANAQVSSLEGVWDGQRQLRYWKEDMRLIVGQEGAWLEVMSSANSGFVKLSPSHMENTGVVFTFISQKDEGAKNQRLVPSLATGKVLATRYTDERGGDRILLRFPQSDGHFGPAVILKQPRVPSLRPSKVFIEKSPTSFAYRDWQSRENAHETSPGQAKERLQKTLATPDSPFAYRVTRRGMPLFTARAMITPLYFLPAGLSLKALQRLN